MEKQKEIMICSFCELPQSEVKILIKGISGAICNNCTLQALQLMETELNVPKIKSKKVKNKSNTSKPVEIHKFLDQYVIAQEKAKKIIAVAVYNHYKRLRNITEDSGVELEKSNIIIVGRTGTGKTLLAKTIAKLLNVPFAIVDATVFTESGYVGEDVESIISRLLQVSNYDVALAERGIIYIDELDKIARKSDNPSITRDVSGEGVQQGLLKLLEGTELLVPPYGGRKHPEQKMIKINTQNILFICGGAFDGIEPLIAKRVNRAIIGFKRNDENINISDELLQYVSSADLKSYGLIPELIGRLPIVTHLEALDFAALKLILTEPKNALLKQYTQLFVMENVELVIEPEVIDIIAENAINLGLGARGLRTICEAIFTDIMYILPSEHQQKFILTKQYSEEKIKQANLSLLKAA